MESNESSCVSSPELQPKRSSPELQPKSPTSDSLEKPTYIRFLVSNAAAGSVIGKGGSTITDFQSQSGARIQLSRNHEFFPGTSDRIIMISGSIDDILKAVELVLSKLLSETPVEDGNEVDPRSKVRLIVPNSFCGGIIGKGGATIKSFIEESRAGIKISSQDNNYYGLNDRLVTVMGTLDEQMQAIDLILSKLSEDAHYPQSMNVPYSYAAAYNTVNYGPTGGGAKYPNVKEDRSNSMTIGIADDHIGLVVGRGGRNIMEISQASGAKIKISDRGDFMSGTTDRKVTITGSQRAIQAAESMIRQKQQPPLPSHLPKLPSPLARVIKPRVVEPTCPSCQAHLPELPSLKLSLAHLPELSSLELSSPEVPSPEVLTPEVLTPEVLSPEVPSPEVLTPEVLSPEVLSPEVPSPEVLTPEVLSPEVLSPEVRSPEVRSPELRSLELLLPPPRCCCSSRPSTVSSP